MDFIKKYWVQIVSGITALWGVYGSTIVGLVAAHPRLVSVLGILGIAVAHLVPSPASSSK